MRFLIIASIVLGVVGLAFFGWDYFTGDLGGRTPGDSTGFGVSIYDDTSDGMARLDGSTEALNVVDYEHHEIHGGDHYFITKQNFTTEVNATTTFAIRTPNSTEYSHFLYTISTEKLASTTLFANVATTTSGTEIVAQNSNRNSNNTASTKIYFNAMVATTTSLTTTACTYAASTTPCIVEQFTFGAAGTAQTPGRGGSASRENELILRANTIYYLQIVSGSADDNWNNIRMNWYEHTDRN